jgi:hypothetical protein
MASSIHLGCMGPIETCTPVGEMAQGFKMKPD